MTRGGCVKNPIAFLCAVVSACCLLVVFVSILRLPDPPAGFISADSYGNARARNPSLGVLGEMMISMLPQDLVFTVFVPSQEAFGRDLRLTTKDSLNEEHMNDTYATVSRLLGFSTVPRGLSSAALQVGKEATYESLSGFLLQASKDKEGLLSVNGIRSVRVDIRKGDIIVHIMDGVLMDADFEQSIRPDNDR